MRATILLSSLLLGAVPALAGDVAPSVDGARDGGATVLLVLFALLILVPFVPGLLEVYWPRDRYPLPLDEGYTKDSRYLGRSARRLLDGALGELTAVVGRHAVRLSREEEVDVSTELDLPRGSVTGPLQYVTGPFTARERAECERDVFCRGNAALEHAAVLRALACDGDARLEDSVRITRWIDVEGDLHAGRNAVLGAHACAGGRLELADGVRFTRLTGTPVCTTGWGHDAVFAAPRPLFTEARLASMDDITDLVRREKGDLVVTAGSPVDQHLVVLGDLRLEAGAVVHGSVKVHGAAVLEAGAAVLGNLFVEGAIRLEAGARVGGNVFTQDAVRLGPGSRVGAAGGVKSVVARRDVTLAADVIVHGCVTTSGEGRVRCPGSA